jgi:hypothetical protein
MTFQDFLTEIKTLRIEELRAQREEYFEAVISKADLNSLHKILTAYFGPPLKPEGQGPSGEANRRAEPYGGIRKDQTMYFRQDGDHSECALLWPWGNGIRITVKIIQSQSPGPASERKSFLKNLFSCKP